jgi:hypothetical protein
MNVKDIINYLLLTQASINTSLHCLLNDVENDFSQEESFFRLGKSPREPFYALFTSSTNSSTMVLLQKFFMARNYENWLGPGMKFVARSVDGMAEEPAISYVRSLHTGGVPLSYATHTSFVSPVPRGRPESRVYLFPLQLLNGWNTLPHPLLVCFHSCSATVCERMLVSPWTSSFARYLILRERLLKLTDKVNFGLNWITKTIARMKA